MSTDIINVEHIGRFLVISKVNDTYDLVDATTNQIIVEDLYLKSAACGLAYALDEKRFEDVNIITFLEARYVKHIQNMEVFENTNRYDMYLNEKIEAESLVDKICSFCRN